MGAQTWYTSLMPTIRPEKELQTAEVAVRHAQAVRIRHRKRTERKSPQRAKDLDIALDRLREAMKPLRTEIARFPYGPQTDVADTNRGEIRKMSAAVQKERQKLWKMQDRTRNEDYSVESED